MESIPRPDADVASRIFGSTSPDGQDQPDGPLGSPHSDCVSDILAFALVINKPKTAFCDSDIECGCGGVRVCAALERFFLLVQLLHLA